MLTRVRARLTYANIVSSLALFFAFSTAGAFAATKLITGKQIKNSTIASADVKNNSLTGTDIKNKSITAADLAAGVGGAGAAGAAGPAGPKGDTGAQGPAGPAGAAASGGAPSGAAGGDLAGTYPNPTIKAGAVTSAGVLDDSLGAVDLAADSVGNSEIADDTVGSAEISPGIVGSDELDTVHEHTGAATDITDGTAHDGSYTLGTQTVSCGVGEDLLSVSVDWTAAGGHNERMFVGVSSITRGEPDTATVQVSYDGGATTATFVPVATCIF